MARSPLQRATESITRSLDPTGRCFQFALKFPTSAAEQFKLVSLTTGPHHRPLWGSSMKQIFGCGTAIVTPFKSDGSIDEPALRNLVTWQVERGIDFLVPCGTTGETPTLSRDEWLRVVDLTVEVA